jgi:hypothetical protein
MRLIRHDRAARGVSSINEAAQRRCVDLVGKGRAA